MAGRKSESSSASVSHERSRSAFCNEVSTKRARADSRRLGAGLTMALSKVVNLVEASGVRQSHTFPYLTLCISTDPFPLRPSVSKRGNVDQVPLVVLLH